MGNSVVLAIDIGGTYTKIGLVFRDGTILTSEMFATGSKAPFEEFKTLLKSRIEGLLTDLDESVQIEAIGVGAPNANFRTGTMENAPNFDWGKRVPLKKAIKEILNARIYMTNDANAAALGEHQFGVGKDFDHFVMITLGTGLGSGIINDGKLVYGAFGMAGELGHVNVVPDGRQCNCGLQGCLETYVSVTGIKRTVFELLSQMNSPSKLSKYSFDELSGKLISEAALEGDEVALEAFQKTAVMLGTQLADTTAHLEPEAFIISGGLSKAGDILLKPLRKQMENHLFSAYKGKIKILISEAENDKAVLGPAALAWQSING